MTITAPHHDLVVGPDGVVRCSWPGLSHADYRDYHDREWGKPVHGETALLERLCLEGFQTGLSWLVILRKRPAFRAAFAGFDAETVAAFDDRDVERLLEDETIVLGVGDALTFRGDVAHAYANPHEMPARLVLAVFEPGVGAPPRTETRS